MPTWVGRYEKTRDTKKVLALSLNAIAQEHPIVWNLDARIPSDVHKMIALPRPVATPFTMSPRF